MANIDINSDSKIVSGYQKAFIHSDFQSDPEYSPQLVSNSGGKKVLTVIEKELKNCDEVFISVAFITRGGVAPLLGTLKELEAKNHVKGRILTTDYLMFSDPKALDTLASLKNIELRMFKTAEAGVGFHTKGYMFHAGGDIKILIGSSNLTQNAITKNYEWNTLVVSRKEGQFAKDIEREFEILWNSSSTYDAYREEYSQNFEKNKVDRLELGRLRNKLVVGYPKELTPNSMQAAFIKNINALVEKGQKRALLISATGTGKTYASAFAVRELLERPEFAHKKVLFISHREQINKQALNSYEQVFGKLSRMGLYSGNYNDLSLAKSAQFLFSTVQMMSKEYPEFDPDAYSVIILDECHRSGAESYNKIIKYFRPMLLLGMSASPERTDDFDVFSLFHHNIAYEIRLQQALENDLLCPFHYFGITDLEIDGIEGNVRDFRYLTSEKRVEYVISKAEYFGFSGDRVRGLIFCSSKEEAKVLSKKFNETGKYKTVALFGSDSQDARRDAIARLVSDSVFNHLDYIFTVDIFNEGVDIPEINQVIMLRPTESPIIFVQQLGRGLRKSKGKEYVVVLDFIGNYDNNYMIPIALSGDRTGNKDNIRRSLMEGNNMIKGASTIYFDEISRKRIYASIDTAKLNQIAPIKKEYQNLKYKLGRIPYLSDFDKYGELDPLRIFAKCGSYYEFLKKYDSDYKVDLNSVQLEMVNFISSKLADGKRPHELELLRIAISGLVNLIDDWKYTMKVKYPKLASSQYDIDKSNAVNVLRNEFFNISSKKEAYRHCVFISPQGTGDYVISDEFEKQLRNPEFKSIIVEIIDFGISRYLRDYYPDVHPNEDTMFVLNKKYNYEDVCRLLNWSQNQVATNIGGYKYDDETKTYPVFINYHKDEDISDTTKYEDRFENPSRLIAISKSRRTLTSNDVTTALNSEQLGVRMDLFVRKNKDDEESKEFYYLGEIRPSGETNLINLHGTSAVEITYNLQTPVESNLYEYITETEL